MNSSLNAARSSAWLWVWIDSRRLHAAFALSNITLIRRHLIA